ncbi:hypothetical protein SAMN04488505_102737 [Chitinophaga rupis]|uniref:SinR family protein n=1 Tax=Chitinophaga rupis TaxID=573321 RepID=A0A1H7RUL8_9BACT|nr:SinR family protein [Chitinophaga rupis]SEL63912.1 hypothetical protein SAMN04488505_102737 [Chitinophaga rupis]
MKTYLIGYDLNKPHQDYPELINKIKQFKTWWHYLDSTWIVKSDLTAAQIREYLKPHIDSNDELLVVSLTGEGAWYGFNDKGSKWLKNNLTPS